MEVSRNRVVASAEGEARKHAGRSKRFLNPDQWTQSAKGNPARKYRKMRITVFPAKFGGWSYVINRKRQEPVFSKRAFPTEGEAMVGAFEWIDGHRD